ATGMREGEYLGLQWNNVSLARRFVRVRTTMHRYKGKFVLEETKSRTSRRDIPLPESVCLALAAHQGRQEIERDIAGPAWDDSWNLVFCSPIGTPLHGEMVFHHFKGLLKAAGLSTTTRVHDLRHTFATLLLERGVNMRAVSELLGHASVNITLNTYGHVTPKMQDTALEHITQIVALPEPTTHEKDTQSEHDCTQ
ncbi:MAG TPA: site-specific integrase, partial [Ktedonobacterales bacterium]|nr:site-specific integrase [Ktedonobacterales bacterium]